MQSTPPKTSYIIDAHPHRPMCWDLSLNEPLVGPQSGPLIGLCPVGPFISHNLRMRDAIAVRPALLGPWHYEWCNCMNYKSWNMRAWFSLRSFNALVSVEDTIFRIINSQSSSRLIPKGWRWNSYHDYSIFSTWSREYQISTLTMTVMIYWSSNSKQAVFETLREQFAAQDRELEEIGREKEKEKRY